MDNSERYTNLSEEEKIKAVDRLVSAINSVYVKPRKLFFRAFFSGVFSGLGATIGVAIVLAFIGLLVREFGGLPIIGQWLIDIGKLIPAKH